MFRDTLLACLHLNFLEMMHSLQKTYTVKGPATCLFSLPGLDQLGKLLGGGCCDTVTRVKNKAREGVKPEPGCWGSQGQRVCAGTKGKRHNSTWVRSRGESGALAVRGQTLRFESPGYHVTHCQPSLQRNLFCVLHFPSIVYSCNTLSKGKNSINTVNPHQ